MVYIKTFVIFDIETTGLPFEEYNKTKITELSFLAVNRNDIRRTKHGDTPLITKLCLLLNPERVISQKSADMTGLTNDKLKFAPTFKQKSMTIFNFLNDLEKPVCLVAHNGNIFDFKILLAECRDADLILPEDLLCVDSLIAFKKLENNKKIEPVLVKKETDIISELMTDDEDDDWPDLNITNEELDEIDLISSSFDSQVTCNKKKVVTVKKSFKLVELYKRFYGNSDHLTAHRAEGDCLMLLQCIVACQSKNDTSKDFLKWSDENCKNLTDIVPLKRKFNKIN